MKTYEDFELKYDYANVRSSLFNSEQFGMLETYGDDLEQVLAIAKATPRRVWTMVDDDEGMILMQGYHVVNRIYYVITKQDAKNEGEEYIFEHY